MVLDWNRRFGIVLCAGVAVLALLRGAQAQECYSGSEIDPVTANALQSAAARFWDLSAQGDVATLKANAVPDVAANFGGIEQAVVSHKALFAEAQPSETRTFVLDATNSKTAWQRADFYCGIYNSPNRMGVSVPNLPPGRYALTIAKATGKDPITLTMILEDLGKNSWKLAGYYARRNAIGDHDGQWFVTKAREFKQKGQALNAWFFYLTAWELLAPVDFISTPQLDKLNDEIQGSRPAEVPVTSAPLELAAGTKSFKVSELAAVMVGTDFDLRVQYTSPAAGNPAVASEDNAAVMRALVRKYPELRDGFTTLIARATDSSGHEYVTMTAMKDVK